MLNLLSLWLLRGVAAIPGAMGTKRCCYKNCQNSAYKLQKSDLKKTISMIQFPKPKHQRERCLTWLKCLGRSDFGIENITYNTVICSTHFVGGSGPSLKFPNPIPWEAMALNGTQQSSVGTVEDSTHQEPSMQSQEANPISNPEEIINQVEPNVSKQNSSWNLFEIISPPQETAILTSQEHFIQESDPTLMEYILPNNSEIITEEPRIRILKVEGHTDYYNDSMPAVRVKNEEPMTTEPNFQTILYSLLDMKLMNWVYGLSPCSSVICILIAKIEPETKVPFLKLFIDPDRKATLTVRNKHLHENHELSNLPTVITSIKLLEKIMNELDLWEPCAGTVEPDLINIFKTMRKNSKSEITGPVYHDSCLLLTKHARCSYCVKLRCNIMVRRSQKKTLLGKTPRKQEDYYKVQNKYLKRKIKRMDARFAKLMKATKILESDNEHLSAEKEEEDDD